MHRFFVYLALAAAGLGLFILYSGASRDALGAAISQNAPFSYGAWALGLLTGLVLASLASISWTDFPARAGAWVRLQRRRIWLATLCSVFAGILLFF
jgi:hypothetical protein